jgi:septal ring factor EnvC (AmiA/AmiB activator)
MVQHRRLQEKVEAGLLKQGGAAAEKLQKTMVELKAKQDAYDQDVAQLMEEDESIGQEIAATETAITESATTIQELTARLETITEAQKDKHGVAVVKVGGNVFSGNRDHRSAQCAGPSGKSQTAFHHRNGQTGSWGKALAI